jgi:hypothetical protein
VSVVTETELIKYALAPPIPELPKMEPVNILEMGDALYLQYDDYRKLERNVIAMREYIQKLEAVVEFYRGKTE